MKLRWLKLFSKGIVLSLAVVFAMRKVRNTTVLGSSLVRNEDNTKGAVSGRSAG